MKKLLFKKGDIIVRTESRFENIATGDICCITMTTDTGSLELKEAINKNARYSKSSFRHATQEEIDAYYKGCKNIKNLKAFKAVETLLTKIL